MRLTAIVGDVSKILAVQLSGTGHPPEKLATIASVSLEAVREG